MHQPLEKRSVCGGHMTRSKPNLRIIKGAVGRLIAIDPWRNGTCTLIAKGTDLHDP